MSGLGSCGGVAVLELMGLFGLVAAGLFADSLMSSSHDEGADADGADDAEQPEIDNGEGDLTDYTDDNGTGPSVDPALLRLDGTDGDDILGGTGADEAIYAGAGIDQIEGGAGDDRLFAADGDDHAAGGLGDDWLEGGFGNDSLHGEDGADRLAGDAGDDALFGHNGADTLDGGEGNDTLLGGDGDDRLSDAAGDDWLSGGFGDDWLSAGAGADTLDGNEGNDTLDGSIAGADEQGVDFLNGGDGDDVIALGNSDIATGGAGADTFALSDWLDNGDQMARIMDYVPADDQLVVVFDAEAHPNPQVTVEPVEGTEDVTVLLNGVPLAVVQDAAGLEAQTIRLQPAA